MLAWWCGCSACDGGAGSSYGGTEAVPTSRADGTPRRGRRELVTAANCTLPRLSAPGSRLSPHERGQDAGGNGRACQLLAPGSIRCSCSANLPYPAIRTDRKSTRLNSSHLVISYAVFCLKKKNTTCTNN